MKKIRFIAALFFLVLVNVLPVSASEEERAPKVVDGAELLTEEEEAKLTEQINAIVEKYQIDVVLVTEYQKQEADIFDEADRIYNSGGYGLGDKKDGMLFIIEMNEGRCGLSRYGNLSLVFSKSDLDGLFKNVIKQYFDNGRFAEGYQNFLAGFAQKCEEKINAPESLPNAGEGSAEANAGSDTVDNTGKNQSSDSGAITNNGQDGETVKTVSKPRTPFNYIIPALIFGLIVTVIGMSIMGRGRHKVNEESDADIYRNKDATLQIHKEAEFISSSVTKKPVKKETPGK